MTPYFTAPGVEVYCGDCLDVLPTLEAQLVDAILTDLPYGTTACAWDSVIPFEPLWAAVKHVLKPRGVFVTTASQPFTSALVMSNLEWFKYEWVWEKSNAGDFMTAKIRPRKKHENILVFSENGHLYNPQMENGKPYIDKPRKRTNRIADRNMPNLGILNTGTRHPGSIQRFSNGNNGIEHPTQKPVALYEYLTRTYTNPGDTVLDLCFGSGTTGVAAVRLGRRFIGIELDERYCEIAVRRISEALAQPRLFTADEPAAPQPTQAALFEEGE